VEDIILHEYDYNAMKIVVSNLKGVYPNLYVKENTSYNKLINDFLPIPRTFILRITICTTNISVSTATFYNNI
jgi:hypothetical protein